MKPREKVWTKPPPTPPLPLCRIVHLLLLLLCIIVHYLPHYITLVLGNIFNACTMPIVVHLGIPTKGWRDGAAGEKRVRKKIPINVVHRLDRIACWFRAL